MHNSILIHLSDKFYPIFRTCKNGVKSATVIQLCTVKHLFLVKIWAAVITRLESYPVISDDTPVNIVWV